MPRDPHRRTRLESELQRVVSDLLRREVRDPRVGAVTITAVKLSPDLKHAKLFYSPFDPQVEPDALQTGLEHAARFLRGKVGRVLELRVAPELMFKRDEQIAAGERLSTLIDRTVAQDRARGENPDR